MVTVNGTRIEFREDMALADALAAAGIDIGEAILITVDGVYIEKSSARHAVVGDGAEIVVMPILSGG